MEILFVADDGTQMDPAAMGQAQGRRLEMLLDVSVIVTNLSKLERYCNAFLSSGGIFAMVGLISERDPEAIRAGILTLNALSESSAACRKAIVEQGAASKMLQVAERGDAVPALRCLITLSKDQHCASKIAEEPGAVDMLLHLTRQDNKDVAALALEMLLLIAKDSATLWEELVLNADVDSALALLNMGPTAGQGSGLHRSSRSMFSLPRTCPLRHTRRAWRCFRRSSRCSRHQSTLAQTRPSRQRWRRLPPPRSSARTRPRGSSYSLADYTPRCSVCSSGSAAWAGHAPPRPSTSCAASV